MNTNFIKLTSTVINKLHIAQIVSSTSKYHIYMNNFQEELYRQKYLKYKEKYLAAKQFAGKPGHGETDHNGSLEKICLVKKWNGDNVYDDELQAYLSTGLGSEMKGIRNIKPEMIKFNDVFERYTKKIKPKRIPIDWSTDLDK